MGKTDSGLYFSPQLIIGMIVGGIIGLKIMPIPENIDTIGRYVYLLVGLGMGTTIPIVADELVFETSRKQADSKSSASAATPTTAQVVGAIAGGITGILSVRYLVLDEVQVMGWKLFWEGLAEGDVMDLNLIFESSTFWVSATGFALGAIAGISLIRQSFASARTPKQE